MRSIALLLAALLVPGCTRTAERLPTTSCDEQLAETDRTAERLAAEGGARNVSRARLERLDRALDRAAIHCRKGPRAVRARVARAALRERIARVSRAPEDIRAALLAYADLYHLAPSGPQAARALWSRAVLSLELDSTEAAFALLRQLVARHPRSPEARRATLALSMLAPRGRPAPGARPRPRPRPAGLAVRGHVVDPDRLGIRFPATARPRQLLRVMRWSTPAFSRVVSYFSHPVRYLHGVLPAEDARPARLYVDFPSTRLGRRVTRADAVKGHLVHGLRLANRPPASTRLVLELSGALRYQIYPLRHPYRVVIDLWKPGARPAPTPGTRPAVRVVALDPGHGGAENGAVGPTGLKEKDVSLAIARHAAEVLRKAGIKVVLTRETDKTVTLEERSAIALAVGADLFVSIHANADPKGKQSGVETYYLDVGADEYAARLASRENRAAGHAVGSYRLVLADLTTRANTAFSRQLALAIQRPLVTAARVGRPGLPDRGVRRAIFYVLLTARVPGVLTEVSFVSHPAGEAALRQPAHQQRLGRAIARGILRYAGKRK